MWCMMDNLLPAKRAGQIYKAYGHLIEWRHARAPFINLQKYSSMRWPIGRDPRLFEIKGFSNLFFLSGIFHWCCLRYSYISRIFLSRIIVNKNKSGKVNCGHCIPTAYCILHTAKLSNEKRKWNNNKVALFDKWASTSIQKNEIKR